MPDIMTIRKAVQRAKADGFPVSEYTLRQWIRTGAIPVRKAGTKILLYYPNLASYLRSNHGRDNQPCNKEIREYAAKNGVRLWQIAARLGIHDSSFSRKLRKELPQEEREKILAIIDDLAEEDHS